MKVGVVDYGAGNLFSLLSALRYLDFEVEVADQPAHFQIDFDAVILPGVGAFQTGMEELRNRGLVSPLRRYASQGRRLLGICLGAQLLLERGSEFGSEEGLGIIGGSVEAMDLRGFTTPVVGWAPVQWETDLFGSFTDSWMYFVHSFEMVVRNEASVLATSQQRGSSYTAAVREGSTLGFQFHPEKSGPTGLQLLKVAVTEDFDL